MIAGEQIKLFRTHFPAFSSHWLEGGGVGVASGGISVQQIFPNPQLILAVSSQSSPSGKQVPPASAHEEGGELGGLVGGEEAFGTQAQVA